MPNDQFGRPVSVGDTVTLKGEVVKVLDDPNYLNCTVKLAAPMPPSGAQTNLQVNTTQLEVAGGAAKPLASKSTTGGKMESEQHEHGAIPGGAGPGAQQQHAQHQGPPPKK